VNARRKLAVAAAAAIVATAGDLLMLLVANAARPELALPRPPPLALPLGAVLGVAAIPLYALGYRAVARGIERASPRRARLIRSCGLGAAAIGAAIHGATALAIRSAGSGAAAPLDAVAQSPLLVAAWTAAAALVVVASAAIAGAQAGPRALVWLNPAAATLVLALAGLPGELGRSFLVPAAPNLAHVVFFCAAAVGARGAQRR
jgi:hypothetical protein